MVWTWPFIFHIEMLRASHGTRRSTRWRRNLCYWRNGIAATSSPLMNHQPHMLPYDHVLSLSLLQNKTENSRSILVYHFFQNQDFRAFSPTKIIIPHGIFSAEKKFFRVFFIPYIWIFFNIILSYIPLRLHVKKNIFIKKIRYKSKYSSLGQTFVTFSRRKFSLHKGFEKWVRLHYSSFHYKVQHSTIMWCCFFW